MTITRRLALLLVFLSGAIFILWGSVLERKSPGAMVDFKAVYYGSRCLLQHADPYQASEFLRVYQADGARFPSDSDISRVLRRSIPYCVNLPATLLFIEPFALLPWGLAHVLWMILTGAGLVFAAVLQLNAGSKYTPGLSLFLICLLLVNAEILLAVGNAAGIVVGLCAIAVWCILSGRFAMVGVLCLAVGLAIKPQDAGPVWLCFLLLGGVYRKHALQTLVITLALALPSALWVTHIAPHWMDELRANLATTSSRGDINDPGPSSIAAGTAEPIIDLQSFVSILRDDPRIYNAATYLVCAPLMLVWAFAALRLRPSPENAWIGLAAITALSLVVTYHRLYDAKLLLFTIPACALLWAEGGLVRWLALVLNTIAIAFTGDISSMFLRNLLEAAQSSGGGPLRTALTALAARPTPIVLLVLGIFYLWVFARRAFAAGKSGNGSAQNSYSHTPQSV